MSNKRITVALAGNPNSGKTTIFNNITGARQHVGNYPGVTVEKKEGFCRAEGVNMTVVDLPGAYSLTAHSLDELVARNYIVEEQPDVLVNIVDASNLERNLYLTVQLLELERPVVVALNMADVAEAAGVKINDDSLAGRLGVKIARTVGNRNKGTAELLKLTAAAAGATPSGFAVDYGQDIEGRIARLTGLLAGVDTKLNYPRRWLAIKLLENDGEIVKKLQQITGAHSIIQAAAAARAELKERLGDEPELVMAERRYQFIARTCAGSVGGRSEAYVNTSDKIDRILTNRVLGLPVFLLLMWVLFNFVFTVGAYPQELLEEAIGKLGKFIATQLPDGELKSLVVDGIIGGVGSVFSFLPNILLLFFGIALLEDTGYMARAAFLMDRVMRSVGLHGKSFIPMLLGFGCTLPAIMGARTLENPRDRLITILVAPLMSCSARLPVYTVMIGAFFAADMAGTVLFSVYLLGIMLAIVMARVFRLALLKGDSEPFIMEMPPYRMPTIKSILLHMWERSMLYVNKAGTIILAVSVIMWFLMTYPADVQYSKDYEGLKQKVEEKVNAEIGKDVLKPLNIAKADDNEKLTAVVNSLTEAQKQFKEAAKDLKAGSPELAAATAEHEQKLKALETANPEVYSFAARLVELQAEMTDGQDKIDKEQSAEKLEKSYAGRIGKFIEPALKPMGFDWKIGIGLIAGFTAKEVLISTLGTIYSISEADETSADLLAALQADSVFNPVVAYGLMIFVLLYSPCLATVAVIKRETNSWQWAAFSTGYTTGLAWVMAVVIYQGGQILGF